MKKRIRKQSTWLCAGLIGMGISAGVLLALICGLTGLILGGSMQEVTAVTALAACLFLAAFIGGLVAVLLTGEKKIYAALINCFGLVFVLLMFHFLIFPGKVYGMVWTVLAAMCGSMTALLVGNAKKGRGYHRMKKHRFS